MNIDSEFRLSAHEKRLAAGFVAGFVSLGLGYFTLVALRLMFGDVVPGLGWALIVGFFATAFLWASKRIERSPAPTAAAAE